jgi:uncharacterized protein with HEPN domain
MPGRSRRRRPCAVASVSAGSTCSAQPRPGASIRAGATWISGVLRRPVAARRLRRRLVRSPRGAGSPVRATGGPPDRSGIGEPVPPPPGGGGAAAAVPVRRHRLMAAPSGKHLWDAWRAAERVSRFTAGKSSEDYRADEVLRSAVERQLVIVGEALAALRRADPALAAEIPELPRAVAFRSILVHATPQWTTGWSGAWWNATCPGCGMPWRGCCRRQDARAHATTSAAPEPGVSPRTRPRPRPPFPAIQIRGGQDERRRPANRLRPSPPARIPVPPASSGRRCSRSPSPGRAPRPPPPPCR